MISIPGVRKSESIRAELAQAGQPVLLAFSCGKDAIAAWIALQDSGVNQIVPYYLYYVPGLRFVEASLDRFEQHFETRILRYPHPSLYRWLNSKTFQPPERLATIEAAALPEPNYADIIRLIEQDQNLPAATWVADGVRAADSIIRRVSIRKHGPMKPSNHKVSVIWDWRKARVYDHIAAGGCDLPPDYEWFGRSFDGLDRRFIEPLSRHAPDDYQRILDWFPLADLELIRHGL